MSEMKNWKLMTKADLLFSKYGYGMRQKDWDWFRKTGDQLSKEQHLAFEVALATGKKFYPKTKFAKDFQIVGYALKFGSSRDEEPVLRPNGNQGDYIITSHLAWAQKEDDQVNICTESGSHYTLVKMNESSRYRRPAEAEIQTEELDKICSKYFKFRR